MLDEAQEPGEGLGVQGEARPPPQHGHPQGQLGRAPSPLQTPASSLQQGFREQHGQRVWV